MPLLISDANILIDADIGGLLPSMFSMSYQFAVPDILFFEKLADQHGYLLDMGLASVALGEDLVMTVLALAQRYRRPSRNDLSALALAAHRRCALLTGDRHLRIAAQAEQVEVHGTLWLVAEMLREGKASVAAAERAFQRMREEGRRLPWQQIAELLCSAGNGKT